MNVQSLRIDQVRNRKELNTFLKVPWKIYDNDVNWVPPLLFDLKRQLNTKKNPFFEQGHSAYWIAKINGQIVGRIGASIDKTYNSHYNEATGFFGFFECINDLAVSESLLLKAKEWLHSHGMRKMLGPINLNTLHECGLLIDGFDRAPILQMSYNPTYYEHLLEAYGLKKEIDLLAYYITEEITEDRRILGLLERVVRRNLDKEQISFRHFNRKNFKEEVSLMRSLFNDFMSDNWGFVPLSKNDFDFIADSLKLLIIPELVLFASVNNQVVGLSLALPDINHILRTMNGKLFPFGWFKLLTGRKSIKDIRVMLMGIRKPFRNKGIESYFYLQTIKAGYGLGFTGAELSWVTEHNTDLIRILEKLKAKLYKRYRVYKCDL